MLFQMACRSASSLQEEFHFHAGQLDHVVILERVRRGADLLAIDRGPVGPFHVRDEVALRPAGQHRDPDAGLAERSERLGELELLAGVGARQQLDGAERLRRLGGRRGRGPGILVCDSGGGGAGGCLVRGGGARSGRRTMVFSKSAFSAPATGAGSPTNLSLYLPSSTTSLFCRKCFLIGLPLTTVPLVLPRSSRNESFRMVTITACSPLTARLSIWMSLWGLRPMVVRSFVKGISLSTSPSMLSISFAIADPLGRLF